MLYALELGAAKLPFTYTPFAALLFAAGSGVSFATWQVGLAVLTIGLLPVSYCALPTGTSPPAPPSMPSSLPGRNRDGTAATLSSSGAGQDPFDGQQS